MTICRIGEISLSLDTLEGDVCVIGAGAAGLFVARRLADQGRDVILLESGLAIAMSSVEAGFEVDCRLQAYGGAVEGRSFGLGGTTSRWGGQLIPYSKFDLEGRDPVMALAWKRILDVVAVRKDAVGAILGLGISRESPLGLEEERLKRPLEQQLAKAGLPLARSVRLPFSRRNMKFLAGGATAEQGMRVYLDATASGWKLVRSASGLGKAVSLTVKSRDGRSLSVSAKHFVIAAGAIESTRILFELNTAGATPVLPVKSALGIGLSDHLSVPVALIDPSDRHSARKVLAPTFADGLMHSLRIPLRYRAPDEPAGFAHFVATDPGPGFELARTMLQGLQAHRLPQLPMKLLLGGTLGLATVGWDRIVRSRLHVDRSAQWRIQLDLEQNPRSTNKIVMGNRRDAWNRLVPEVWWCVDEADQASVKRVTERLFSKIRVASTVFEDLVPIDCDASFSKPYDTYHPVGTCRMGEDEAAVVDLDLTVRGTSNVSMISTALFPSAGTANPTFSLLCLADELAGRIERVLHQ